MQNETVAISCLSRLWFCRCGTPEVRSNKLSEILNQVMDITKNGAEEIFLGGESVKSITFWGEKSYFLLWKV